MNKFIFLKKQKKKNKDMFLSSLFILCHDLTQV